ncbi:hypothetical protein [Methanobrevibacter sp.]|uniref:hypothetical protein n=1 Tax=Methanobrevibacter sp. TaxID=66852 RepID=UPI003FA5A2C6
MVRFINSYKSASSRLIKKQYPVLKKSFMEKCILENRLFYYNSWWSKYMKLFVSILNDNGKNNKKYNFIIFHW